MNIQEAISVGLSTSIVGLAIVFAVLLILMVVLKVFEKIFYKPEKKAQKTVVQSNNVNVETVSNEDKDEEELIAILTAAVAASLNTSTYNLKIKSYRRVDNNSTPWSKAGIRDTIYSRYN